MILAKYFPGLVEGMTVLGLRGALPVSTKVQTVQPSVVYARVGLVVEGKKIVTDSTQKIYAPTKNGWHPKPVTQFRPGDKICMVISGTPCVAKVSAVLEEAGEDTVLRIRTATRNMIVEGFLCRA